MTEAQFHKILGRYLAFGSAFVTVFLITDIVTDPVNAPKLFILGGLGFSVLALLILGAKSKYLKFHLFDALVVLFVAYGFLASVLSSSPFSQTFYGVYGRNTGQLAYFLLATILLGSSHLKGFNNIKTVIFGFAAAATVNVLYSSWVLLFGDFIGWQNIYKALLGTFGNPNFISSFLGLVFSSIFVLLIQIESKYKFLALLILVLVGWQLINTDSIQGLVIAVVGTWIACLFWLSYKIRNKLLTIFYFLISFVVGLSGIFGALGSGPLKSALAQPTIALREQYWYAAWKIATSHPFFGVGMDSFGDWYRRGRGAQALITPGIDTVTNAAHSVYLDLLSYGGFPLLLMYLLLLGYCTKQLVSIAITLNKFEPIFVILATLWISFHIQAAISINQLGLAIWGWVFSGLLLAYKKNILENGVLNESSKRKLKVRRNQVFSPTLVAFIGMIVGLLISVPPLNADMKWRSLMIKGGITELDAALTNSYMTPYNSIKLASAVQILENSKRPDLAVKYARIGVDFNPEFFDAWKMLYYATNSTSAEKNRAKSQMLRLDPRNLILKELK